MATQRSLTQSPLVEARPALLTGRDLLEMGDIGPCELVEGELLRMSPTKPQHGRTEIRFGGMLDRFVAERGLGEVQGGEVGIYTRHNPDTVRGADILFISHERLARATPGDFLDVAPELVVEILSPGDRWGEVKTKLREYFEIGVTVVLLVDPDERVVSLYRSLHDVRELTAKDVLAVEDVLPGFSVPVADLFAAGEAADRAATAEDNAGS